MTHVDRSTIYHYLGDGFTRAELKGVTCQDDVSGVRPVDWNGSISEAEGGCGRT